MDYLKIGHIQNTHGLKGELIIEPLSDDLKRFNMLKEIYIDIDNQYISFEIENIKIINKKILIKLKNYDDINKVLDLKFKYLYIDRDNAIKLNTGEYFTQDLIDCIVYYNEQKIGKIINVHNFGSCDIIVVKTDNKEIDYPFLEKYIDLIDIKNKLIKINQIEGFFID